jgi:hypothetical protein
MMAETKKSSKKLQNTAPAAPSSPGGIASPLQGGGTIPGASPGASMGSIGTGGGSSANESTGNASKTVRGIAHHHPDKSRP